MFNQISYEISMSTLIKAGYLVPLTSKASFDLTPDTSNVKVNAGEYVMREIEMLYDEKALNKEILKDIKARARGRESILVFCSGVAHAEKFFNMLDEPAVIVTGDSLFRERDLALFKERKVRWLVSVDVLTTGFDAPNIDCIVLLRPTKSPGLYCQLLGRGVRLYEAKDNCLVLDYAGNLERFGPVDQIGIRRVIKNVGEDEVDELVTGKLYTKFCPSCGEMCGMFLKNCPSCSFTFAMETMGIKASESSVMGGEEEEVVFDVLETTFKTHKKAGKPNSFRLDYNIGAVEGVSEYLLFEHNAWGRKKAQARWRKQCFETFANDEPPETVADAFGRAMMGELKGVSKIKAKKENGFWRVLAWKWDESKVLDSPDLYVAMSAEEELLDAF
jgi:DNA repair protein RadD